jgi:hypothetical protein
VSKIVLVVVNTIFLLLSILLLIFGIIAKANPGLISDMFDSVLPESSRVDLADAGVSVSDIVVTNAVFMIVVGAVGIVVAGFGFVGACCLVRILLVVYAILLILLLLGEIALIIFAAVKPEKFKDTIQDGMLKTLKKFDRGFYIENNTLHAPNGVVEIAWSNIQLKEKCCGAMNYSDYATFDWNKNVHPSISEAKVPLSCCKQKDDASYPPNENSFQNIEQCLNGVTTYINQQNCFDAVEDDIEKFIDSSKAIAIGIAAAIAGVELSLIIMAFFLCYSANNKDSDFA